MPVFDKKCQFLLENDDYLIKYAYFLKNKALKCGGTAFGENSWGKKRPLKTKCPKMSVFDEK